MASTRFSDTSAAPVTWAIWKPAFSPALSTKSGASPLIEARPDRLVLMKPRQVTRQRRNIGMVFQRFDLFPRLTGLENVVELRCA